MTEITTQLTNTNIDLTNLYRDTIHTSGQIQPHGVVLVLQEPELKIIQASTNTYAVYCLRYPVFQQKNVSSVSTGSGGLF